MNPFDYFFKKEKVNPAPHTDLLGKQFGEISQLNLYTFTYKKSEIHAYVYDLNEKTSDCVVHFYLIKKNEKHGPHHVLYSNLTNITTNIPTNNELILINVINNEYNQSKIGDVGCLIN